MHRPLGIPGDIFMVFTHIKKMKWFMTLHPGVYLLHTAFTNPRTNVFN
jgi:hypothetical protein